MKEAYPLAWPDGWPRTLLKDREHRKAWKKTERQSIEDLELELKRFDTLAATLTRKDPQDFRTAADPSVSVFFSRRREDDFSWQTALGILNPSPTIEEIDSAFQRLARKYHPDLGGDTEMFVALSKHKAAAIAFINRLSGAAHDFNIACDKYHEARWNILAISNTVYSLRQMERDGTSRLLERALAGFAAQLTEGADREHVASAAR
jgi:hypothetical protein